MVENLLLAGKFWRRIWLQCQQVVICWGQKTLPHEIGVRCIVKGTANTSEFGDFYGTQAGQHHRNAYIWQIRKLGARRLAAAGSSCFSSTGGASSSNRSLLSTWDSLQILALQLQFHLLCTLQHVFHSLNEIVWTPVSPELLDCFLRNCSLSLSRLFLGAKPPRAFSSETNCVFQSLCSDCYKSSRRNCCL